MKYDWKEFHHVVEAPPVQGKANVSLSLFYPPPPPSTDVCVLQYDWVVKPLLNYKAW